LLFHTALLAQTLYHQQGHFWLYTLVSHDHYPCFDDITCRKNFTSDQQIASVLLAIFGHFMVCLFFLKGKWQGRALTCCQNVSYGPHMYLTMFPFQVLPCAVLALLVHPSTSHNIVNRISWAFCVYLEAVSVLPQLRLMQNTKVDIQKCMGV
jgi:hypothetical protein